MKIQLILVIISLLSITTGCTPEMDTIPEVGIPLDDFNKDLVISFPPQWNTFKIGEGLTASIVMNSDLEVVVPSDYNVKIFVYEKRDEEWVIVENYAQYYETNLILDSSQKYSIFGFNPKLNQNQNKPLSVFILIFGYELKDGQITNNRVGAYSIIKLYP